MPVVETLFLLACLALLGALFVWGFTVRRLARRIETAHPDAFEELRGRSRKGGRRLAVTSEIQLSLGGGRPLPDPVLQDPACTPLIRAEGRLRLVMLVASVAAFAAFLAL